MAGAIAGPSNDNMATSQRLAASLSSPAPSAGAPIMAIRIPPGMTQPPTLASVSATSTAPAFVRRVHLRKVVQDAYEYHGLWDLALFTGFAVLCTLVLFFHWEPTTAALKSTMQASFVSWGGDDWAQSQLFQKSSIQDGYDYLTGYLGFYINQSGQMGLDEPTVRVDDYGDIVFARLLVNLDRSCQVQDLPCYRRSQDPASLTFLKQRGWKALPTEGFRGQTSLRSASPWMSLTLVSRAGAPSRQEFMQQLQGAMQDDTRHHIGKFAYAVALEMFVINVLGPRDSATFAIHVQRTSTLDGGIRTGLQQFTTITPLRTSFYRLKRSLHDRLRLALEVMFLVLLALHARGDLRQFNIAWTQHKDRDKLKFFKYHWNNIQIISTVLLFIWGVYYVVLLIVTAGYSPHLPPKSDQDMHDMQILGTAYSSWLWGYIVVTGLLSVRMVRYMRIHVGLRAFYQVFVIAAKEFADFAVIMAFIMLLLGAAVFAFFQLSGGNAQFLEFGSGISVMARLTFNLLDYNTFYNNALGLGTATYAVTILFWCSVILLQVFSQNIILAIVTNAYDAAKSALGRPECSFFSLILQRLLFGALYGVYWTKHTWDNFRNGTALLEGIRGAQQTEPGAELKAGPSRKRLLLRVFSAQDSNDSRASRTSSQRERRQVGLRRQSVQLYDTLLAHSSQRSGLIARWTQARWAAWALVRNREFLALVALYQDFATLKLKRQSPWDVEGILQPAHNPNILHAVVVPDLESHVTAAELAGLLRTAASLHASYGRSPNPFQPIPEELLQTMTTAVMDVYSWQAEAVEDRLVEEQADMLPALEPAARAPSYTSSVHPGETSPMASGASLLGQGHLRREREMAAVTATHLQPMVASAVSSHMAGIQEQLQVQNQMLMRALSSCTPLTADHHSTQASPPPSPAPFLSSHALSAPFLSSHTPADALGAPSSLAAGPRVSAARSVVSSFVPSHSLQEASGPRAAPSDEASGAQMLQHASNGAGRPGLLGAWSGAAAAASLEGMAAREVLDAMCKHDEALAALLRQLQEHQAAFQLLLASSGIARQISR